LDVKTRVRLGAFELKTFLIGGKGGGAVEADLIERQLTGVKRSSAARYRSKEKSERHG